MHSPFHYSICWCNSWVGISHFYLTRLNIEALLLLYIPLQIFRNHTDAVDRIGIIHTSFNKFGKFWIPFQELLPLLFSPVSICSLLWLQSLVFNAYGGGASRSFPRNNHKFRLPWKGGLGCTDYPLRILMVRVSLHGIKKGAIDLSWSGGSILLA